MVVVAAGAALFGMLVALIVIRQWRSTMPEHITAEAMEALDSGAPKRTYSGQYLCQLGVFCPQFFDRYGPFFRVLVPVS